MNRSTALLALFSITAPMLASAGISSFQCVSEDHGTRNVTILNSNMSVVNPKTPNIIFSMKSDVEKRGNIVKYENEAWLFYDKAGMGSLTNKTFGDKYGCVKTGQVDDS